MKNNQQTYVSPKINVMFLAEQDVLTTSGILSTDGLTAKLIGGSSERTPWVG